PSFRPCVPNANMWVCEKPYSSATARFWGASTRCFLVLVPSPKRPNIPAAKTIIAGAGRSNEEKFKTIWRDKMNRIEPRSGTAFRLKKGQTLTVRDPNGEQVADLLAYNTSDTAEVLSSGRTLDYASRIFLTTGDPLYSNRSNIMLDIIHDDVGRHDFLLTPCSEDTFRIIYGDQSPYPGCFGNLKTSLPPYHLSAHEIPA